MKEIFSGSLDATFQKDVDNSVGMTKVGGQDMYRWVQNAETNITFSQGDVACHFASNGTTALRTIRQMTTANLAFLAGVVRSPTIKPLWFGWLLVKGCTTANITTGTAITAGDYMKGLNGSNYLTRDTTTPASYTKTVQCLDTVTAGAAAAPHPVFVDCL